MSHLKSSTVTGSKIFGRNRSLGYVTNQVPAQIRYFSQRKDTVITTCIGRSFQVYSTSHFRLLHVSPIHPEDITAMAVDRFYVYTACGKDLFAWRVGKYIKHSYKGHTNTIHTLKPFRNHLIAVDQDNVIKIWDIRRETVYLEIPFAANEFLITAVAHPPTYINKIVLGSQQGQMKIWNLKRNHLIYTFRGFGSKVTCIEPAPALDVAAIGHQNGKVILLNLKFDEVLVEFKQDWGAITQISFRTDGSSIMATGSTNGHIAFWNLDEKKIANQLKAHDKSVTTLVCLPSEPLLLSTSPDNSMKLWIFDMPDGGARLLKIREGHRGPPLCIRYHGQNGQNIISSGEDSTMRIFSTVTEILNHNMGKASYNRKLSKKKKGFESDPYIMPPIIQFTTETTRDKDWDSIAAIHAGIVQTTTWSFHKKKMGELRLVPEKLHNNKRTDFHTETTCLALTHCGNFVIIGYSNGDVERFNIQSGIHRASYGKPAHNAAIRGVACDSLNQFVATGCSGGVVKFWPFKGDRKLSNPEKAEKNSGTVHLTSEPCKLVEMPDGVALMRSHQESGMIGVALDNFSIYILDSDTKSIIRKFDGHTAKINDATFSPDSRWLITAAMDSTIKVWHIPSAFMVDHFKVERPCVSLTMSPTGDFLATAHVNYLGIYLWANKTLFNHISLRCIDPYNEAPYIELPSNFRDEVKLEEGIANMNIKNEEGDEVDINYETPNQLSPDLITLSGEPESRWQNLIDLDLIKKRNKPKAPPKVPKQAPFFLPTVAGLDFKFDLSGANENKGKSKVAVQTNINNLTTFGKLLEETIESSNFNTCVEYLKKLGPSMVDFELKSLHPIGGGSFKAMVQFIKMITHMLSTNMDFELSQAYLSAFLRSHGTSLTEKPEIIDELKVVQEIQQKRWSVIEQKLLYGMGVVASIRNSTK